MINLGRRALNIRAPLFVALLSVAALSLLASAQQRPVVGVLGS
jgi:hypothetical protein